MQQVNSWSPPSANRAVRVERWSSRSFYASACRYFLDVPLDMTGLILNATREAQQHGHMLVPGGAILATDSVYRGAVLLEIVDPRLAGLMNVVQIDGEVLARALPEKGLRLRSELDELVRWSNDLGHEVTGCYVQYEHRGSIPGAVKASQVFATIRGEHSITEPPPPPR
ncbi:MAG: hypothetical protein ACXVEE_14195 [Polyangiales bacterium]